MNLSRPHGLATACGMGLGAGTFALLALSGLHAIFTAFPLAFLALKVLGGLYLLYLASLIIRHAASPLQMQNAETGIESSISKWQAFRQGLWTQLSNPKTAIVFASIFSALLPAQIPLWFYAVLPLCALLIDGSWYVLVAYILSAEAPRNAYLKYKTLIDRIAGTVMALLGLRLVFSALI